MIQQPVIYLLGATFCYGFFWLSRRYLGQPGLRMLPGPPSLSLISGNLTQFFKTDIDEFQRQFVSKFGGIFKMRGWFGSEILFVTDTKALHSILVKDQHAFEKGVGGVTALEIIVGLGLLGSRGEMHRRQRKSLNPVFSIAHMREIVPIFWPVAHKLRVAIESELNGSELTEVNVLSWINRAALELIGQAGLGYSFDDLDPKVFTPNTYLKAVKEFVPTSAKLNMFRGLLPIFTRLFSRKVLRKMAELTPYAPLQKMLEISDIMQATAEDVLAKKRAAIAQGDKALLQQIGEGKDIMSILLQENMHASEEDRLPDSEVLAQMATFIFAGSDTTSNALARILHVLAFHPDAQQKLRNEIIAAKEMYGGDIAYDDFNELPYLDAVIRETMRLYAPVPRLTRTATQDILLPLATPIRATDGTDITSLLLRKGTQVIIGVRAVNVASSIWGPDAGEWKPERWLEPLPESVVEAKVPGVYANLLTFLGGNRACIGFKFSQLEMKVVLCELLPAFTFSPSNKEIEWQIGAIQSPKVKGVKGSSLPLKVGLVNSKN